MKTVTVISIFLVISLMAGLVGCTSNAVADLQIALDAITTAFPIIAGLTGVPPNVITDVVTYLEATNQALAQASTILAGSGTDAEKTVQIMVAFANIAKPVVPAQYASLVSLIATVASDVATFLANLPPGTHATAISSGDRAKLSAASVTAANNKTKFAGLHRR